ncbi:nitroreductase family protein [Candidatus Woesearchaeota archaeon]|jgi:nitroreductase|nr:nitroreductase family protein [Candidatus Woesearchaeota archaeon]MBT5739643.1 nitroreductase family protein [Candidatus Woesearchaeota archaeon]
MNPVIDAIKTRRNVKHFVPKIVSWEKIAEVLDAARYAPSSGNLQNWKFIVVTDPAQKQALAEAAHEQYDITLAGALIVVCGEPEKAERYYGMRGERLFTVQNCAAAIQNMLLAAHSLNLGTAWIGVFDEEAVKNELDIPEKIRPQAIIALGYVKEQPEIPAKYPLTTQVFFGKWGGAVKDIMRYLNVTSAVLHRKAEAVKDSVQTKKQFIVDKTKNLFKKKS